MRLRYRASHGRNSAEVQDTHGDGLLQGDAEAGGEKIRQVPQYKFEQADITRLGYPDASFDAAVAANVIHLLDAPYAALRELDRVCRPGGRLIIPTYMNRTEKGTTNSVSDAIGRAGADFKREFTLDTYKQFFADAGYIDASYTMCSGRIPCAVAILRKEETHEGNDA